MLVRKFNLLFLSLVLTTLLPRMCQAGKVGEFFKGIFKRQEKGKQLSLIQEYKPHFVIDVKGLLKKESELQFQTPRPNNFCFKYSSKLEF